MSANSRSLPPTPLPDDDRLCRAREWFERLRAEGGANLPAFKPAKIDDNALTDQQRYAVSHAVSTPDVCMIDTDAPTGRMLAATIARHAVDQGERVLLIAPENEINQLAAENSRIVPGHNLVSYARLTELTPLIEAYRAGRWWSPKYWRVVFGPSLKREFEALTTEAAYRTAQVPDGISLFTPNALLGDPRSWDRMIVCGTGEIDRPVLCALCARADRWVFIGHDLSTKTEIAYHVGATWKALASDIWVREGDKLCCRIRPLTKSQREHLSSEPLSDAPDIELRIYQPDNAQPELAEVVFPPNTTLAAAKELLVRELDEWPIDLEFAGVQWNEDRDRLTAYTGHLNGHEPLTVEMNPGVRELVADCPGKEVPWSTCGIAFDRAAGWDRSKAEAWLQTHCASRTRRTVWV
jgi:hypothetical protein